MFEITDLLLPLVNLGLNIFNIKSNSFSLSISQDNVNNENYLSLNKSSFMRQFVCNAMEKAWNILVCLY